VAAPAVQRLATGAILVLAAGVAVAAIASSVGGSPDATTSAAATPSGSQTAPTAAAVSAGDIRSLPSPPAGTLPGILTFSSARCGIQKLDLATGRATAAAPVAVCRATFSPDGTLGIGIPIAGPTSTLVQFRAGTRAVFPTGLRRGNDYQGPPVISDAGTLAACTSEGLTIEFRSGDLRRFPRLCATAAVGDGIVALTRDQAAIIDPVTGATRYRVPVQRPRLRRFHPQLVASPNGAVLAVVGLRAATGYNEVTRVSTATGRVLPVVRAGNANRFILLDLSNDGRLIAMLTEGGWDVWNLARHTRFQTVAGVPIDDVSFSPDSKWIAVATDDGIAILDADTLGPRYLIPGGALAVAWR
jgi:hypothetical protein